MVGLDEDLCRLSLHRYFASAKYFFKLFFDLPGPLPALPWMSQWCARRYINLVRCSTGADRVTGLDRLVRV